MQRRDFVKGVAATAVATSLPLKAKAAAVPLNYKSIIFLESGNPGFLVRTLYHRNNKPSNWQFKDNHVTELSFCLDKVRPSEGIQLDRDGPLGFQADRYFMLKSKVHQTEETFEEITNPYQRWPSILFEMERAKNSVAKTTRRGRANQLIAPSHTLNVLAYLPGADITTGGMEIHEFPKDASLYPDNRHWIFVFYRRDWRKNPDVKIPIDVPGLLISNRLCLAGSLDPLHYGRMILFA